MSSKLKLTIAVVSLVLLGFGLASYKVVTLKVPFWQGDRIHGWQIEAKVSFYATGKDVLAQLALPPTRDGLSAGDSGSLGYKFHVGIDGEEQTAVWSAVGREGAQSLYYWVRVDDESISTARPISGVAQEPDVALPVGMAGVAAEGVVKRALSLTKNPDSLFVHLFGMIGDSQSQELSLLKRGYEREFQDLAVLTMGIDLLRYAGVPARLAYGVELREESGVQQPLPLVEYYDGVYWKVRDPRHPEQVLDGRQVFVWHRGDGALLDVMGGENSGVVFAVAKERVPHASMTDLSDSPLLVSTILGLPLAERAVFRYLVLIPLGAFVVVLLRNVIGVPTLGTFMPVLIALALLEIPLGRGLLMFSVLIGVGLWFRFLLSRLNLLVVPRVAACVVIVTLLMMLMSVISHRLGYGGGVEITLFPMIILAWTIERMSLIWEEEGRTNALFQVGGSLLVAVIAFLFMKIGQVRYWAFYFPELLLVLLAGILCIGRYTGYRVSELIRFKNFTES